MRLIMGAFTGTISASISLVASVLPGARLGFGLGLTQVAVFAGMSLGPWIGGVIADIIGYRLNVLCPSFCSLSTGGYVFTPIFQ